MGQPFFGQPGMNFNPMMQMMQQSPEMAKKMRAIMGLREMWQLRLTARDIAAILPPLRELAQAEKSLQARSEQLLEDERKALLSADPEGNPPDGSGELMLRENDLSALDRFSAASAQLRRRLGSKETYDAVRANVENLQFSEAARTLEALLV